MLSWRNLQKEVQFSYDTTKLSGVDWIYANSQQRRRKKMKKGVECQQEIPFARMYVLIRTSLNDSQLTSSENENGYEWGV